MDSLFEVNVKSIRIKGDTLSLYIYQNNRLILKVRYSEIKSIFKFAVEKDASVTGNTENQKQQF